MSSITRYALCLIFSPDYQRVLTLEKRSGPALLIGRICGVGGKIDPGETDAQAAVRETREEACLELAPETLRLSAVCSGAGWEMSVFSCVADLSLARQGAAEPIQERRVSDLLLAATQAPDTLSPDLAVFLTIALQQRTRPFEARLSF